MLMLFYEFLNWQKLMWVYL